MNINKTRVSLGDVTRLVIYVLMLVPFIKNDYYELLLNNNSILVVVASLLLLFSEKKYVLDKKAIWLMGFITLFSMLSTYLKGNTIGNMVFFYWIFILPIVYKNILNYKKIINIYIFINFIFLLLILKDFSQTNLVSVAEASDGNINPNTLGSIIGSVGLLNMMFISCVGNNKFLKTINIILTAVTIFGSSSRTSFFSFIGCLIFKYMLDKGIVHKANIGKYLRGTTMIVNTIVVILYKLYKKGEYSSLMLLGKRIMSGRELIWEVIYKNFIRGMPYSLIIGINEINSRNIELNNNCHNSYIEIITRFGILVLFVCIDLLIYVIFKYFKDGKNNDSSIQHDALAIVYYYLLSSSLESVLFSPSLIFPFGIALGAFINQYEE